MAGGGPVAEARAAACSAVRRSRSLCSSLAPFTRSSTRITRTRKLGNRREISASISIGNGSSTSSQYSHAMTLRPVPPARHLLRAKDLIDARYREPLDVPGARAGRPPLARALQPRVPPRLRRDAAPVPADPPAGARRRAPAQHRPLGRRHLRRGRAARASARSRRASAAPTGSRPTAYRAAYPPAADRRPSPRRASLLAWGRPQIQQFSRRQPRAASG